MNSTTEKNLFPQTTLHVNQTPDGKRIELRGNKMFAAIPKNQMADIGVNWLALCCLLLFVAATGGLIYSVGDAFSVQYFVNKVVVATEAVVRLGKNPNANLSGSNLPLRSVVSGQITFILSGVILLSVLGLLWSLLARSRKYKNGCRQRQILEDMIIMLRGELLGLVVGIRAATVKLEQATADTKSQLTALLENQVARFAKITSQLQCLGDGVQQMNALVETMQEVAEQINIAALNMSIRAATAGDASRGIAIAEEVRRLTEQSGSVANKINERLKNIQQEANGAISSIESTTVEAKHNIECMHQVEQAEPIDEKITAQQSASDTKMSELAPALEQMKLITHKLKQTIVKFDVSAD